MFKNVLGRYSVQAGNIMKNLSKSPLINQNAMNDVTSIYLVRDMHKTVTIFLCMNLKKIILLCAFCRKKKEKKTCSWWPLEIFVDVSTLFPRELARRPLHYQHQFSFAGP